MTERATQLAGSLAVVAGLFVLGLLAPSSSLAAPRGLQGGAIPPAPRLQRENITSPLQVRAVWCGQRAWGPRDPRGSATPRRSFGGCGGSGEPCGQPKALSDRLWTGSHRQMPPGLPHEPGWSSSSASRHSDDSAHAPSPAFLAQMLNITQCESCTGRGVNQDSVFCRNGTADVSVFNATPPHDLVRREQANTFCWDGSFGVLLSTSGTQQWAYGQPVVTWNVQCDLGFLLYNQCILSALVAIILISFGSVVCVVGTSLLCVCMGCCNCCFIKRKYAESDDDMICCLLAPCDSGDKKARDLILNPMAAREKERKELESEGGLI